MKRTIILIKKFTPDAVFIIVFGYIILNPDRLGTWFGVFLKNLEMVMGK